MSILNHDSGLTTTEYHDFQWRRLCRLLLIYQLLIERLRTLQTQMTLLMIFKCVHSFRVLIDMWMLNFLRCALAVGVHLAFYTIA